MAGIDFGSFMNTFVGLQQRQAEETRKERDDAFEIESAKIKLGLLQEEGSRQERYMKLQEQQGARQGEAFTLEQQRRDLENQTIAESLQFQGVQDRFKNARAMAAANQMARGFEETGDPEAAKITRDAIEEAKKFQQTVPHGTRPSAPGAPKAEQIPVKGPEGEQPVPSAPEGTGGAGAGAGAGAGLGAGLGTPPGPGPAPSPPSPGSQQPAVQNPARQSPEFYKKVREAKEGEVFRDAAGMAYKKVQSPEQVQAIKKFWQENSDAAPPFTPVSGQEMEIEERQMAAQKSEAVVGQMAAQEREELATVYQNQDKINQVFATSKATSKISVTSQGVTVEGFDIKNLPRERAAVQSLAAQYPDGKVPKSILRAMDQAFANSLRDYMEHPPEGQPPLSESMALASPGEYRIKRIDSPGSQQVLVQNMVDFSRAMEAQGIPSAARVRQSTPRELVQDTIQGMPQGSQMREMSDYEKTVRGAIGFERNPKPIDPATTEQVEARMAKLAAALSRSLYEMPPGPEREQAKADARQQLEGMKQNYFIGQDTPYEGLGRGKSAMVFTPALKGTLKSIEAILKPSPKDAAAGKPASGSSAGPAQSQLEAPVAPGGPPPFGPMSAEKNPAAGLKPLEPEEPEAKPKKEQASAGGMGGMRGMATLATFAMAGAGGGKTPAQVLGAIGPGTKDKKKAAEAAISEVSSMSKDDRATLKENWEKSGRAAWKAKNVDERELRAMDRQLGVGSPSEGKAGGKADEGKFDFLKPKDEKPKTEKAKAGEDLMKRISVDELVKLMSFLRGA